MSNYELGVVVPLYDSEEADNIICWERPPKSYQSQGDQPWVGVGSSVPHHPLLRFVLRFRVNPPCSVNWTGYRELCVHKYRVDSFPDSLHQVLNLPGSLARLTEQRYGKGKFNKLNFRVTVTCQLQPLL